MSRNAYSSLAALALALTAAGCSGLAEAQTASLELSSDSISGSWRLVSGNGADGSIHPATGDPLTLFFEESGDGSFVGSAGCGMILGTMTASAETLDVSITARTVQSCTETETELEDSYMQALQAVSSGRVSERSLELLGDGVELSFEATGG